MRKTHAKPPLRSLQVFEAAARCGSFTAAGDELGITQSGVSRQISDLEATLGIALFERKGAKISVTPAGSHLADRLADGFALISNAVTNACRSDRVVTLSMLPSVATRWFAPRLGRFMAAHPDIDLRISASRHLVDFAGEGIDAAIRYSTAPATSLEALRLGSETIQPVCTPLYAKQHELNSPHDLYRATLLYADIPENWPAWFAAANCADAPPPGPRLGDEAAILQATLEHQGVALGRSLLVADDIKTGRLVHPFPVSLKASHCYWFVRPKNSAPSAALEAVRDWIVDTFASA